MAAKARSPREVSFMIHKTELWYCKINRNWNLRSDCQKLLAERGFEVDASEHENWDNCRPYIDETPSIQVVSILSACGESNRQADLENPSLADHPVRSLQEEYML